MPGRLVGGLATGLTTRHVFLVNKSLNYRQYLSSFFYSKTHDIVDLRWGLLDQYLSEQGREVYHVGGGGYCLLVALVAALEIDYNLGSPLLCM